MDLKDEVAAQAARYVVEEGLDYGPAKQRAARALGVGDRSALPNNDQLEQAVKEYLALFCGDTQPGELRALRGLALQWMERLAAFRPYLSGAVWRGTATHLSDICLDLFCDDSKSAEIALIDQKIAYTVRSVRGLQGEPVDTLSVHAFCAPLNEDVGVHLVLYDRDDVRGALKPDGSGHAPRGDAQALRRLLAQQA
ncbi:MAG: hypothetical protein PHH58_09415 [Rhodoferax sp.]|nr:hypothetical protein [Rhodoferax sp.]